MMLSMAILFGRRAKMRRIRSNTGSPLSGIMKTLDESLGSSVPGVTVDEAVQLLTMKDEEIDFSDIPPVRDFSRYRLVHEEALRQVPKPILRAFLKERQESIALMEALAKRLVEAEKSAPPVSAGGLGA
jgi:hypothetical protein